MASVAAAIGAGAPVVQVRGKGVTDRELYEFTRRGGRPVRGHRRPGASSTTGSTSRSPPAPTAPTSARTTFRSRRPGGWPARGTCIGGTARDPDTAAALVAAGADYLGVGPAFATTTKSGLPDPIGPAGIGAVARAVPVPVIAIGGVTADRVPALLAQGAYGVAVVGAVADAADPAAATRSLLAALSMFGTQRPSGSSVRRRRTVTRSRRASPAVG